MNAARFDRRVQDRWQARGGTNPPKRSGRFTKPGPRPRAASLAQAKQRSEMVEKADAALRQLYPSAGAYLRDQTQAQFFGRSIFPATGDELYTVPSNPFQTNPFYDTATTNSVTVSPSVTYTWGVDYAASGTDVTSISIGTTATDVTSSGFIVNPTFEPVTLDTSGWVGVQHQVGDALQNFGQAAQQAGDAMRDWATNFQIHVDPLMPPGQIQVGNDSFIWQSLDKRQQLRQQMVPERPPCRADGVSFQNCSPPELTALTLLKKMVDEDGWRTYLKYGFVNVRGKSGLDYQIRRGHWHVLVRRAGQKVAELCVGFSERSQMPPTDEVIARMIIAECDEPELWRRANVDHKAEGRRYYSGPQNGEVMERIALAS